MPVDNHTVGARDYATSQTGTRRGYGSATLTGDLTLTDRSSQWLRLDPGGAGRDVILPAVADGLWFELVNTADAAEALTVKDDGGATVVTISQNEKVRVVCDASGWAHLGIVPIALT